ncbi:MAG: TonB-dependent receptor [Breznakibacter sp.]
MKALRLVFFLFICMSASAQKYHIGGRIIDSESKHPISGVSISTSNAIWGTVTDREGGFILTGIPQGEYMLLVSAVGYEPVWQKVLMYGNADSLQIELHPRLLELEQVVVTATRTERNLKNIPIAVQVISGRSIEKMHVSNMRDLLEYELPGTEITNNGGYASINMLGFGGKYVLFLIDGERMAGESFDNIDYNRIDVENIERIEIVKGASSSLYGSNAVGGVINIITKKPTAPLGIQSSVRAGSLAEYNGGFSIGSKQKWYTWTMGGACKTRDPYLITDRSPLVREFSDGETTQQALAKTYVAGYKDYSINPRISVNFGTKLKLETQGGYFFKERHPGGMDGKKVRDRFYDFSGGAKALYTVSDMQHLSVSCSYDNYDKYYYYRLLDEKEKNYGNAQRRLNILYDLSVAQKHSLVAGLEYFSEELVTYMFDSDGTNEKRDAQTYSVFAQQDWILSDKATLVGGLRYDYHSRFKSHFSPRLSAMYRLTEKITIRGGYSGGFRSPTLKELYTDWFHPYGGGFQIIGNKDMKAEICNNFNLSTEATWEKTLLSVICQYSVIDNKINTIWVNNDTVRYANMGGTEIFSTELSISQRFGKHLQMKGGYAYVNDGLGKRSVVRPHTATFRVDYTTSFFKAHNPMLSFSGKYFGGMNIYGSESVTDTDNVSGIGEATEKEYKVCYDPYSVWKFTATQTFAQNFSINAGINNLFGYKPKFYSFYSSILQGRTFYVGLKWKFSK